MSKRLLVCVLVAATLTALTACSGATISSDVQEMESVPVELEVAPPPVSETPAPYNELLDPEFGCNGGGSLEYGLVDRPDLD